MARFRNTTINKALVELRTSIREGKTTVYFKDQGPSHLKRLVAAALETTVEMLDNNEYFNPQTVHRLNVLFNVPFDALNFNKVYPTQDDTATALQNFINRRKDPWAHVRPCFSGIFTENTANSL